MNMALGMTETTMLLWSVVLGLIQIAIAAMAMQQRYGTALQYQFARRTAAEGAGQNRWPPGARRRQFPRDIRIVRGRR